ncbi:MAG: DoxX family protein, partial [Muribaculaceae bacterium]|nr:DoxX family protein [Muribaculaceae bacterium]
MSGGKPVSESRWFPAAVWTLRLAVGAVFVMSGLVKAIDLWGFVFKLEEYAASFGFPQPRSVMVMTALFVSGYEFMFGFFLATGCFKRAAPWGLALMMLVMLPLTLYIAVASPVSDCGCFGDFFILSNTATFLKNVALAALIALLLAWNSKVRSGLFAPAIQWVAGVWTGVYLIIIALFGYNVQPMLDFRPFPAGTPLAAESDDDTEYAFIYERDGVSREFPMDSIPDGDGWTFVDRVPKGTSADDRPDFAIFDGEYDVTESVIATEGWQFLLVLPEPAKADISYTYAANEIYQYADSAGIPMAGLLATDQRGIDAWLDLSMAGYPCYSVDDTQLKELSRGTMALVILLDGKVYSKEMLSSIPLERIEAARASGDMPRALALEPASLFKTLTVICVSGLLLLYMFQGM